MNIFKRVTNLEKAISLLLIENGKMKFQLNKEPKFKVNTKYAQGVCIQVNILAKERIMYSKLTETIYCYEYRFQLKGMVSIMEDYKHPKFTYDF